MNYRLTSLLGLLAILTMNLSAQIDSLSVFSSKAKLKTDLVDTYPQHILEYSWNDISESWSPYSTVDITYTSSGMPASIELADPSGKSLDLFTYDNHGQEIERISKYFEDGTWVNSTMETTSYLDELYSLNSMSYEWNGTDWELFEGTKYEYAWSGSRVLTMSVQYYRSETGWTEALRHSYEYSGTSNVPSAVVSEMFEDGQWNTYSKVEYVYEGDLPTAFYMYVWEEEAWQPTTKMTYEYGAHRSSVMISYSWLSDAWMPSMRITETNDSHENLILSLSEYYTEGWATIMGNQYELTYNGNDVTQRITKMWALFTPGTESSSTDQWKNVLKEVFSDFTSLSTQTINQEIMVLRVYPNPSSDYIEIDIKGLENKQYSVSLINIEGKVMLTRPVSGVKKVIINKSIVSLPDGVYMVIVTDMNNLPVANKRIIIQK